nr:hypothetical protein [Tanacetum cinerariifolium]
MPSFDSTCYSEDGNSFTYDSTSNLVYNSPNVFSPPLQPLTYSYEFCGNDAYYGHDCSLQVPFTYDPKPCYNQDFNFPQNFEIFQQYPCCTRCGGPHETVQCDQLIFDEPYCENWNEHLDTIPATESDEFIKSSVERHVPILTLKDNPTPSSDFITKSSSTSLNFLLEETNTFDNSLPEFKIFRFDLEEISSGSTTTRFDISFLEYEAFYDDNVREISSGSTTTRFDISFLEYEAFYDDNVREISSGSTTTHSDSSLYDSFIFYLSINLFPPADRSDFYEFADELTHIISPSKYDCNEPNSEDFTMDVVEDIFPPREPRVHNALPTHPTLQLNLDFILSRMKIPFLSRHLQLSYLFFLPDVSHRSGTFIKFNVLNESLMEILFSTYSPMDE